MSRRLLVWSVAGGAVLAIGGALLLGRGPEGSVRPTSDPHVPLVGAAAPEAEASTVPPEPGQIGRAHV